MRAVFDTNILIDFLKGNTDARAELDRYESPAVSLVSWMEVLVGAASTEEDASLRRFLRRFDIRPISPEVAGRAVQLRREHRVRLPDAIIWATAGDLGCLLVTRNDRDFPAEDPGIRFPYRL